MLVFTHKLTWAQKIEDLRPMVAGRSPTVFVHSCVLHPDTCPPLKCFGYNSLSTVMTTTLFSFPLSTH